MRRSLLVLFASALALALAQAVPASADTAPVPPVTLTTVSADALPTVQINGVVWDQVIVGNTVYATGEFTKARPAGSAPGVNEVSRTNLVAYNLTTGVMISSWAPTLNAKGAVIEASADGTRIFVGGSFTSVSGVNRYRVVALDASTGAVIPSWNVVVNSRVRSLAVSGTTLYLGGIFSTVGGQPRTRLAAVSTATGAVLPWAPTADAEVLTLTAPPGSGKVIAGGKFTLLNGTADYGMGALNATTGAVMPWAITSAVRNAGDNAAIYSLSTDGAKVYGTGYTFGAGGNFEGSFAANSSDGSIVFINGCLGDTYDSVPIGGVLYNVSHAHNCSSVGANPEVSPRNWQRAQAESSTRAASGAVNLNGNFKGQPAPEVLHWLPYFEVGTFTGSGQAAWTIQGNSNYITLGGEFTKVNTTSQQGIVRFAIRSLAPNKQGPQGGSEMTPTIAGAGAGKVTVSWKSAWDRDNRRLTYELLRGSSVSSAVVVTTLTQDSAWWSRPTKTFTDTVPAGSSQTYRVRVRDALGNVVTGNPATATVPAAAAAERSAKTLQAPSTTEPATEPAGPPTTTVQEPAPTELPPTAGAPVPIAPDPAVESSTEATATETPEPSPSTGAGG